MLIQDITDVTDIPAYQRGYGQARKARKLTTKAMVMELHNRGVTIQDIFGMYYAIEEAASARHDAIFGNDEEGQHGRMTVGDAELAGYTSLPEQPVTRQPF